MMAKKIHTDPEKEFRDVFRVFDEDNDGFISVDELYNVLIKLGETITRVSKVIQQGYYTV
jgi:Ca2+-binding EF-hand superfamily protein